MQIRVLKVEQSSVASFALIFPAPPQYADLYENHEKNFFIRTLSKNYVWYLAKRMTLLMRLVTSSPVRFL